MDSRPRNSPTGTLRGMDLSPLHRCDNYVAWALCEIRTCPWHLAGFWEPFSMLDYFVQPWCKGRILVLPQLNVPRFVQAYEKFAPFWMEIEEEWMAGGHAWKERRERKLQLICKINEKMLLKFKKDPVSKENRSFLLSYFWFLLCLLNGRLWH